MNKLDKAYTDLLQDILDNGVKKEDRTGTGTLSVFGRQIRHKMSEGFPLITTKKMYFKGVVTELLWFLRGDTNIKFLVDNDCHIWDGDAWKNYERRWENEGKFLSPPVNKFTKEELINEIKTNPMVAFELGELGPIYGRQWRDWGGYEKMDNIGNKYYTYKIDGIDQIQNLINDLKTNPDSRRLMVNAWNVGELDQMVLPPCHYGFQMYTRELSYEERLKLFEEKTNRDSTYILSVRETLDKFQIPTRAISLMWNQRSVDTFLGLPFNIASYGLLLEIIAKEVNMVPDELIGNLGDTHLYSNHVEQAKEQIGRALSLEERIRIYALREGQTYEEFITNWDTEKQWLEDLSDTIIPTRTREPYPLPKLFFKYEKQTYINDYELDGFVLKDYQSHPTIKAKLSN
jgi:thymidylate synthase